MIWHILGVIFVIYLAIGLLFVGLVLAGEYRREWRVRRQRSGVVIDFTRRRLGE